MKQWYEALFENYGNKYNNENFAQGTIGECDFIEKELNCNERYYVPSEITWLLKSLGFKKIDIYGAKFGASSRSDKLITEDFEMLVIAKK